MNQRNLVIVLFAALISFGMVGIFATAVNFPTSPQTLTVVSSSQFDDTNYPDQSVEAYAGNITRLSISAVTQTKTWQGYYGNISGTIVLDDANNFTFYNWSTAEPQGEIYASTNNSIDWTNIKCFDYTNTTERNQTTVEEEFNIQADDVDGLEETFNLTNHPLLNIGSITLTGCPTTYVHRDDAYQEGDFPNILVYEPEGNSLIFVAMIENDESGNTTDISGYNGELTDFQMLVLEDGHGNDTATTTYYFWVELE